MRKTFFKFMAMPLMMLFVGACAGTSNSSAAIEESLVYTTIEVNPGIGVMVNEQHRVVYAHALNGDGEMVMLQLQLENKPIEDAIDEIVGEMIALKFIDQESVDPKAYFDSIGTNNNAQSQIQTLIQNRLSNAMTGNMISIQTQTRTYTTLETSEATEKGTTPLKLRLIKQAMLADNALLETEALAFSPQSLLEKAKHGAMQMKQIAATLVDAFVEARQAIQAIYLPQIQSLNEQIATAIANSEDPASLELALATLRAEMIAEIQALVLEFRQQTVQARMTWQNQCDDRRGGSSSHPQGGGSSMVSHPSGQG